MQPPLMISSVQILRNELLSNHFLKVFDSYCQNAVQKSWTSLLLAAEYDSINFVIFMLTHVIVLVFNHWQYDREKWQLVFSIICISLISNEMEYFFIYFLFICISYLLFSWICCSCPLRSRIDFGVRLLVTEFESWLYNQYVSAL